MMYASFLRIRSYSLQISGSLFWTTPAANSQTSHLDIKILPPFYRTAWSYLLYTLCISIILYFIVRTYKNRIKLQGSLRYEQKHAEDIEQLNQTKLRFFTNISHESRTPLTLIIGQMEMLADIFAPFYQVFTACDGEDGWEKVQSEHPHLILSDVVMPKMSGTDLCKLVKENLETCHIPVVLLTARTSIEHSMEGLRLGADDYITKPFNVNILLSRCNNLINNRIMLQEKFSKHPQETPQIIATNPMDKEFIDKAMKIIDQHIDNIEFNVDMLAREIGIVRSKLFTKLKDITGKTPYDFIVTIRLKRAAILLKEHPELNISEISDKLDFSSPRQFSKSFKEKYQVVPQAYRKGKSDEKMV
ncbi:response regulator [Bacteroides sp. AN502(2024)]